MASMTFIQGCAIIMATKLPLDRDPEELVSGRIQGSIDRKYGYPVAAGMSADGREYIEQVQFVDGIHMHWKVTRIVTHAVLDDLTIFLWEFIGTPIELCCDDYPEYVYYLVYDDKNRLVRKIDRNSPEGEELAKLKWSAPILPTSNINRPPTVYRIPPEERK